jgi:hypothetical protein
LADGNVLIVNNISDLDCSLAKSAPFRWTHETLSSWDKRRQMILDKASNPELLVTKELIEWYAGLYTPANLERFFIPNPDAFRILLALHGVK